MPQAHPDLRALMQKWFGDPIDDGPPMRFLESRGYVCTKQWTWIKPTPSYVPWIGEIACMQFLAEEWDMGWFHHGDNFVYRGKGEDL